MIYLDASVLLATYFDEEHSTHAVKVLALPEHKVSSALLSIESTTVLRRRLGGDNKRISRAVPSQGDIVGNEVTQTRPLEQALARLNDDLNAISLFTDIGHIDAIVRQDARFACCRTLDAIHVATAMYLGKQTKQALSLATFDKEMIQLADRLKIPTIP